MVRWAEIPEPAKKRAPSRFANIMQEAIVAVSQVIGFGHMGRSRPLRAHANNEHRSKQSRVE